MSLMSERIEAVRSIVESEVASHFGSLDRLNVTVCQFDPARQPRLIVFHVDQLVPVAEGRFRTYCNAVDLSDSDDLVRDRCKAAFQNPEAVLLYSVHTVNIRDLK